MVDKTDWRHTNQEEYLTGVTLIHIPFSGEIRDHDHCEFCGAKFSEEEGNLHQGYCTEDKYYWICPECFDDFKGEFNWIVRILEE